MKHLIIRADSTSQIGVGHVMRCIALGQAWQDNGGKVIFISHCESTALQKRITDEGFDFFYLGKKHSHPSDLEQTLKRLSISSQQPSEQWVLLDGYHFDSAYQNSIKDAGYKILWIDDYGHADHYCADVILNQNITANESLYNHREHYTRLLLGTRYVLLRREFKKWQGWQREIPATANKVLVTLGGSDPDNVTLKVMQAFNQTTIKELEAKIVVGPANPNLQTMQKEADHNANIQIITNATDMPELIAWADIAVTAGGSTCWEMAFMGLPNIIIILADNQKPIAMKLHKTGVALNLGWFNKISVNDLGENIKFLLLTQGARKEYSTKSKQIVDGLGAQRVCEEII